MSEIIVKSGPLKGEIEVPGDKSISHRALMFGALAKGTTEIDNFLRAEDCLSTARCMKALGVDIEETCDGKVIVHGAGLKGLREPSDILDVGNSGTTLRLLTGILAGQAFFSVLTGDSSIRKRPMGRVVEPLRQMGASIGGRQEGKYVPLAVNGSPLKAIDYTLPVASAQLKSALLLAGLYAEGVTRITEPAISRDHTERMLAYFGASLEKKGNVTEVTGDNELTGRPVTVPGDISSAAFFMVAAAIIPGSQLTIKRVGINPTRDGIITVLKNMGADIQLENKREISGEPVGDIVVRGVTGNAGEIPLKGTTIKGEIIPLLIDEIPVLAVAAAFAEGPTVIADAEELRVKESDRIATMARELRKMGAVIDETPDGMIVQGGQKLKGTTVESHGDHRVAMALAVAGLAVQGETVIEDALSVNISFPNFFPLLNRISLSS